MSLSRLAFTFDAGSFGVIKALLESEGIGVLDMQRGANVAIAGADQGYYIQVLDEDRSRAARVLRKHGMERYLVEPPEQP